MTLQEYKLGDRNFLFDSGDVPEGAELIGKVHKSKAPGSFEELVNDANPLLQPKQSNTDAETITELRGIVSALETHITKLNADLLEARKPAEPVEPEPAKTGAKPANKAAPAPDTKE